MKKRKLMNALMVLIIVLIAACGVMAVKSIKGPVKAEKQVSTTVPEKATDKETEPESEITATEEGHSLVISETEGIVTVERMGIAYEVDEQTEIRTGDKFGTRVGSKANFAEGASDRLMLGAGTKVEIVSMEEGILELIEGEILMDARDRDHPLTVHAGGTDVVAEQAVYLMTARPSAYTVYVCSGAVKVSGEAITETTAFSGQVVSILKKSDGSVEINVATYKANSLNDAQIADLLKCEPDDTFCFTSDQLKNVTAAREQEKASAQQELLALEQQAKAELAQQQADYEKAEADYQAALAAGANITTDEDGNLVAETKAQYCTIEIRCDTILDNMDDLKSGKEGYVPGSGKILSKTKVAFEDGDTVFDVLKEVCSLADIQLEYSWTPLYDSYYIEGINHLYEFDCGSQSGWMYKVNGWFPNYGCSSQDVDEGDVIVWCYTCKGLGEDVGGSNF